VLLVASLGRRNADPAVGAPAGPRRWLAQISRSRATRCYRALAVGNMLTNVAGGTLAFRRIRGLALPQV
jgi:hypothetical protein